jgi:hypothetical protein
MIPAFRGEFGLMLRFHVPVVYAMGAGHTIEIEGGNEALYPLASEWKIVQRIREDSAPGASAARGRIGRPKIRGPERRFQPVPHIPQGISADVVIAPRRRNYVACKNWQHWPDVARSLMDAGLRVFAAGVADASDTRVPCDAGWNYARPLDASIEAMRSARLVVAACSGPAHLAVLCGTPLLLMTYRGNVAPGPRYSSHGRRLPDFGPVKMQQYYYDANHTGSLIRDLDGWEHPEKMSATALELLT